MGVYIICIKVIWRYIWCVCIYGLYGVHMDSTGYTGVYKYFANYLNTRAM